MQEDKEEQARARHRKQTVWFGRRRVSKDSEKNGSGSDEEEDRVRKHFRTPRQMTREEPLPSPPSLRSVSSFSDKEEAVVVQTSASSDTARQMSDSEESTQSFSRQKRIRLALNHAYTRRQDKQ